MAGRAVPEGMLKYLNPKHDRRRVSLRESSSANSMLARRLESIAQDHPQYAGLLREAAERIRDLSAQVATLVVLAREAE